MTQNKYKDEVDREELNRNKLNKDKLNSKLNGKLVPLVNVQTEMEAELLMDVLRQEEIPVMTKEAGGGGYMKIYMGYSIYGETVYVYDYDYAKANEILLALQRESEAAIQDALNDAVKSGETEIFTDADAFDVYETEQIEKQEAEAGIPKKNSIVPLGIVVLIILVLFSMR